MLLLLLFETPWTVTCQASYPSPSPGVCSNSYPLSRWWHPTVSSPVIPFSSYLQSFPESGSFPVSQFFTSGGQSIGISASASILLMNIQVWFPLGLNSLMISLLFKEFSRISSSTTVQKHHFFCIQPIGKTITLTRHTFVGKVMFAFQYATLVCHSFFSSLMIFSIFYCMFLKFTLKSPLQLSSQC